MFELNIDTRIASVKRREKITAGSVGIQCRFAFSAEWDGLGKTAVFETDKHKISIDLSSETVTIPWEVCEEADLDVIVGVYGTNASGTIVIPTIYAKLGTVAVGTTILDADNGREPTETLVQQIMAASSNAVYTANTAKNTADDAKTIAEDVQRRADAGEFKGEKGDPGATGSQGVPGTNGRDGVDGAPGADGTSVTVESVSESTESGGVNRVTFSDGKTLNIRNGRDGEGGGSTAASDNSAVNVYAQSFDVKKKTISQGGVNLETGSYYPETDSHYATMLHTVIRADSTPQTYICDEGFKLQLVYFAGASERGSLGVADSEISEWYAHSYSDYGRAVTTPTLVYTCVHIMRDDGGEIVPDDVFNKIHIVQSTEETNDLRICAFNVGNFAYGASGSPAGNDTRYEEFMRTFAKCNAHVYMFSEWDNLWTTSGVQSTEKFKYLKPYWSTFSVNKTSIYAYQKIASSYELKNETTSSFEGGESRHLVDCTITYKGKEIHLIAVHSPCSTITLRDEYVDYIIGHIKEHNYEYFIVGGDFNIGTTEDDEENRERRSTAEDYLQLVNDDISRWTNAGMKSIQGAEWVNSDYHLIKTKDGISSAIVVKAYDNFFYSPNLTVKKAFTVNFGASDHFALCADFDLNTDTLFTDTSNNKANSKAVDDVMSDFMLYSRSLVLSTRSISQGFYRPSNGFKSGPTNSLHEYRVRTSVYAYELSRGLVVDRGYEMQMLFFGKAAAQGELSTTDNNQANYYEGEYTGWSRMVVLPPMTYVGINIRRTDDASPLDAEEAKQHIHLLKEYRVQSITDEPNDFDIPSAKAVKDYVDSVIGGIENGTY